MNRKGLLYSAIALVLVLTACTGSVDKPAEPAGEQIPQAATEAPVLDNDADAGSDSEADQESGGDKIDAASIFAQRCSSCHGTDRQGANGPPLKPAVLNKDAAAYIDIITNGSGPMPSWDGRLSPEEIDAMVNYILTETN